MGQAAVRCAWCDEDLGAAPRRRPGRVRCERCGAWTTDPIPSAEELERAYRGWYRPADGRFSGIGDRLLRRLRARGAARVDAIAPPGRILDVGAGDGALLDALAARGRPVAGTDRRSAHPAVREADLEEVEGEWSAIVFWHSLEHLPRAGAALARAASMLAPGGVVALALPNAGSLQAKAFGDRWFALDLPRHLVHVPARALLDRLDRLGLSVERVSYLRGGQVVFGWLHGLTGLLPGRPDLYDAIRRPAARRRPVSGAGRAATLAAAVLLLPPALLCAGLEVALRRGGTVYVEARRV